MSEIPHSDKMFHLPIEVSVYVPSTQDVDKVVSKSEMKLRVDEVKKYLASLFGGFSSSTVEGGFLASDGKVVKENVERVVSFAPKEDFEKNKEALVQKASEWATKWGQEAIGLEHEGDLYYVPQKFENGGTVAIREAKEMANSQALEIKHHASELANALKGNPTIEAWVIAKLERASNDLADVTHYLEGRVQMSGKKMATGGRLNDNIPSTEDLIELVASEREKKINEWRKLEKVVIGRNDGYSWGDGTTNDNREVATKPSRAKILEIIKNNPNVTEIRFYGTIKVGQRVGQELEIVDGFDVVLWSKEDTLFKKGFQFRADNGKYFNTIIDKSETVEYKNRKDNGEFVYYQSVDKYGNVGQGRIHKEVLQEDLESGDAVEIKKMAKGGGVGEKMIKVKVDYLEQQYFQLEKEMEIPFSVFKEYDKTGKVPREFTDDLISETTLAHHVETNPISVRLTPVVSNKMATGGSIDPNSMEVQFIKYKDEEIMYEPHFKEFYVNDSMFNSLEEAKYFIDKGAPMSEEIKLAYRRGLFAKGGNMEFKRPSYKSSYVASQDQARKNQAEADLIKDENWNQDYENDPVIKGQKKAKETAIRAGMAYATSGASEIGRLEGQAMQQAMSKGETPSPEDSAFPEHEINPELANMVAKNPQLVQMLSGLGGAKGM
jgi:hypothetical protein